MAYRRVRAAAIITAMSIVSGALAGTLVALILDFSSGGPHNSVDLELFQFAAMVGGAFGAVLGPAAAFGFLRRVPIGRLFGQTILGAVVGALLGLLIGEGLHPSDASSGSSAEGSSASALRPRGSGGAPARAWRSVSRRRPSRNADSMRQPLL